MLYNTDSVLIPAFIYRLTIPGYMLCNPQLAVFKGSGRCVSVSPSLTNVRVVPSEPVYVSPGIILRKEKPVA